MAIDRRIFMTVSAIGVLALVGGAWARAPSGCYLGARLRRSTSQFVAVLADGNGRTLKEIVLPGRGHAVVARPGGQEAVAIARRPGNFAVIFGLGVEECARTFHTPPDRHFLGHAVYDAAGRHLLATENDFEGERGIIGIYDANDSYRRIGELSSYGVGPHELVLMPDGKTLVVANGGILTHPDTGRAKLNIVNMVPSLACVDLQSGKLLDKWAPPQGRQRKLSIRHLAVVLDGHVAFACQDQGVIDEGLALAGLYRPGSTGKVLPLMASKAVYRAMAGYCGSVAVDADGRTIAVSAPRGNRVVFWDAGSRTFIGMVTLIDGCGIAAADSPGTFALTSGEGVFAIRDVMKSTMPVPARVDSAPWDNHLSRVLS